MAAAETVALVLDVDSPLPESDADVEELARRLRGHINRLASAPPPGVSALGRAQRIGSVSVPGGYAPSRAYLTELAVATHDLAAAVQACDVAPAKPKHRRLRQKPRVALLCGTIVAAILLLGDDRGGAVGTAVTGALVIALLLSPMVWLILRGDRAPRLAASPGEAPTPKRGLPPPLP